MSQFVEVPLYKYGIAVAHAIVDQKSADNIPEVLDWEWHLNTYGYAFRFKGSGKNKETIYLHRLILGLEKGDGLLGDHISRNKLDNRVSNLRIVTRAGNCQNRSPQGEALYRGVGPSGPKYPGKPWRAAMRSGDVLKFERFKFQRNAARAVRAWRMEFMTHSVEDADLSNHR